MGSAHSWLGCGPTGPHSQSPSHALRPGDVRCRWGSACQSAIWGEAEAGGGARDRKGSRNRDRDVSALHLRRNFATGALSLTHHSSHFGHVHVQLYSCTACVSVWMTILVSVVCGQLGTHSITWATFPAITSSPGDQHTASPSPSHSPPLASLPGLPPAPLPSAASHQVLTLSLARTR